MEAELMVDLLRRVRHDFANHLQVVSGYLDLGQPERVKEYLRMVMEDMGAERIVFESQKGQAALYFYDQILTAYDMGITLRYEDIDVDDWEILKTSGEPCKSLADLSKDLVRAEEDVIVYLSIYEDQQGVDLFFSGGEWEGSPKGIRISKE